MAEKIRKTPVRLTPFTWVGRLVTGFFLLAVTLLLCLSIGVDGVHPRLIPALLLHQPLDPALHSILLYVRGPRLIAALLVGWCLGTAGAVYQGMLQNPLAEPYLLGISGGAALGAALAGLYEWSGTPIQGTPWTAAGAFLGALASTAILYRLARIRGRLPVLSLILAGVVLNAIAGACILYITVTHEFYDVQRIALWMIGQIQPVSWHVLVLTLTWTLFWTLFIWRDAPLFNLMALGDEVMATWGVSVDVLRTRWLIFGAALAGTAVFLAGMVGFVGLIIPHAVRFLFGSDYRSLLPFAGFAGAFILMIADTIARTAWAPLELPVGVLTAALAGPYFLWLLRRTLKQHPLL